MADFSIYRQWRAFRSRELTKRLADGKSPPNTLLVIDRPGTETFLIDVETVAEI